MEQVSAEVWRDAIDDVISAAMHDLARPADGALPAEPQPLQEDEPSVSEIPLPLPAVPASDDLPPVAPQEFADAIQGGAVGSANSLTMPSSMQSSMASSRRTSFSG
jgi:hypothetical protein